MPSAIIHFAESASFAKNTIQVLLLNAGMLNSDTLTKSFDTYLFDTYSQPFDALAATKPFLIIDEPHKFSAASKTWQNIKKIKAQFILRYGATFPEKEKEEKEEKQKNLLTGKQEKITTKDYHNLVYELTAVDSFNRNLVKGITAYVSEFEHGKNIYLQLDNLDGKEASFSLHDTNTKNTHKLIAKDSLEKIHTSMQDLSIETMNKTRLVLSNGLELKKGDTINPYSFADTLQDQMLEQAITEHFKLERELLTREAKIKPLTLFFIDNINSYRADDGVIKIKIEALIKAHTEKLLQTETNSFYTSYLQKTLQDISQTHGGYFSKDNSEKDEAIEKQVHEILHDKQALLSLDNPRRFIFSKWTLKEGWDNPNVFQICKLRSSGSEISKLQEVGRVLRLPVNEYGNRVKDEQFYLNYYVDFTESDFTQKLVNEINNKSGAISLNIAYDKLTEDMITQICEHCKTTEEKLLEDLDNNNIITRANAFKDGGLAYIQQHYSFIFQGVDSKKIRQSTDTKKKVTLRTEKYSELKALWEQINQKLILEYKFNNEQEFKALLDEFLRDENLIKESNMHIQKQSVNIHNNKALAVEETSIYYQSTQISTMTYNNFVFSLAKALYVNVSTLHQALQESHLDITNSLSQKNISHLKNKFNDFLTHNAIHKFAIAYKKVSNNFHPTKFTDESGNVLQEIDASNIGVHSSTEAVADKYFIEELFYDSDLEKQNIKENIEEVIIFTKIPKNSIKIPIAGGKSYSPDFAYVVKKTSGKQKLNFIIETKNVAGQEQLRQEEQQKIQHTEQLFKGDISITFKSQFSTDKMFELLKEFGWKL